MRIFPQLLTMALFSGCLNTNLHAQVLLVVNQGDTNVSVVDPVANRQLATIDEKTTGVHGHEVAASADGRTAFVPIYGSSGVGKPGIDGHEMLVIDIPSRRIVDSIEFAHGVRPHQPVLDPNSGLLYVTTELDNTVTIIDAQTRKLVGTIPTGQAESHMLAISHDGSRGYTANVGPGTVSVLDMKQRRTMAVIQVAKTVQRIAMSSDDKLVFTSDQVNPRLAVIDAAAQRIKSWVSLPGMAYGTAATSDGRWLLIAIPSMNQLAVLDLSTMKVARAIEVAKAPQEVLIRPDGKVAYVSCAGSGQVAAIDLANWTVMHLIEVGNFADGLGWAQQR
jgi:YVTN family beta-propeller protein